jgi:hypothetical protein
LDPGHATSYGAANFTSTPALSVKSPFSGFPAWSVFVELFLWMITVVEKQNAIKTAARHFKLNATLVDFKYNTKQKKNKGPPSGKAIYPL